MAKAENHEWVENIKYFLFRNGFGYAWDNPHSVHPKLVARYVKQRLDDQARQNITASINNSTRFQTLAMLKKNPSTRSEYLDNVSDPIKRQIITRLRIDLNKLATCRAQSRGNAQRERETNCCPFCVNQKESISHFLLSCQRNEPARNILFTKIEGTGYNIKSLPDPVKLQTMLKICGKNHSVNDAISRIHSENL